MANTILTHQKIAREAAAMLQEEMCFISNINRTREKEFGANVQGYQIGNTVKVKIPPATKVFDGNVFAEGGSAQDQKEGSVDVKVSTQKHVALRFTSLEQAMELTDYKDRFLRPAITTLASVVQADFLAKAYKQVPNVVGTAGSIPSTMKTFGQARAVLQGFLAPATPRTCLVSSDVNVEMVDASKQLLNPGGTVSKQYQTGWMGDSQGMNFFECQSLPTHTNGSNAGSLVVSGAGQTGASLLIGGLTAGDTITAGTVFTIDGVYAVHPLTCVAYPSKRQFVVTANFTATATTGTISISPPIGATAPGATVNAGPANGAGITIVGADNTAYRQGLAFHRDAFATAFVPLKVIAGCEGYAFSTDDFAVRVMTGGDFTNDAENTRIDVLYADPVIIRPDHAVRITE